MSPKTRKPHKSIWLISPCNRRRPTPSVCTICCCVPGAPTIRAAHGRGAGRKLARFAFPISWRLEALLATGNSYLVENQVDAYEPLYLRVLRIVSARTALGRLPLEGDVGALPAPQGRRSRSAARALALVPRTRMSRRPRCIFWAVWRRARTILLRRALITSARSFAEYPELFLYWTCAVTAWRRLPRGGDGCFFSPVPTAFCELSISPPARGCANFEPNARAKGSSLARARLLASAGLDDWAEVELRSTRHRNEDQPHVGWG